MFICTSASGRKIPHGPALFSLKNTVTLPDHFLLAVVV